MLTVVASFIIMLCIGSLYAWSILASELIDYYGFSGLQSQVIFGCIIAVFPVSMIFVGRLGKKVPYKYLALISGLLFFTGYFLASGSNGNFLLILAGIGVLAGTGTGFGYWVALTAPVQLFPRKKGLITGHAAAGFGLGAIFMSRLATLILSSGRDVLQLMQIIGITYGAIICVFSFLIYQKPRSRSATVTGETKLKTVFTSPVFIKLFIGIFLGTFAGLMIIGSLKIIGEQNSISLDILLMGVSLFAVANFLGRLIWGFVSDHIGANMSIFLALLFQAVAILLFSILPLGAATYLVLSFCIAFGFGGNFVLFAKETAESFGVENLGIIYPYVFVGYAVAGIAGPMSGGFLFDISGSFFFAMILASTMSFIGSCLFLREYFHIRKNHRGE